MGRTTYNISNLLTEENIHQKQTCDMKLNAITRTSFDRSFFSLADKGDMPVRKFLEFSIASILLHLHMLIRTACPVFPYIHLSPPSALATIEVKDDPRIGHRGTTQRKGSRNCSSLRLPRLGWSDTFEDEGTLATHNMLVSCRGSSRSRRSFRQATCSDVPLTRTSRAGQLSTKAISLRIENNFRQ